MEAGAKGKTYKIGQAAKLLDVKPFVLRFWESEFKDVLVPVRTPSGQRAYTEGNVDLVREIKRLLYDEGLTIEGAKKRLRETKGAPQGKPASPAFAPSASPMAHPTAAEAPARAVAASGQPSLLAPAQPPMQPGHAEAEQAAALAAAQAAASAAEQAAGQANRRAEALAANLSNILTELRAIRDLLG